VVQARKWSWRRIATRLLLLPVLAGGSAAVAHAQVRTNAGGPPAGTPAAGSIGLIVQVLANLFDNVAKYTPPGTPVTVTALSDGRFIRVRVEDEGPGLPVGEPARLFDKFQRGTDEGSVVGVGLGLAICQAIVRAHGGEIEAERRETRGARFEFTLPLDQTAPASREHTP